MNDAAFAARLRRAAAELLPEGAFLRLDRGDALYVTDAPRRAPRVDWPRRFAGAGFLCREDRGLIALTPGPEWLSRLEAEYPRPPDCFSGTLARFAALAPDEAGLRLFAEGMKALEGAANGFERRLRQRAAVALRNAAALRDAAAPQSGRDATDVGGGLYACALIRTMIEEEKTDEA